MTPTSTLPPQAILLQMLFGYAPARAISIVAELRIADLLADGSKTAEELALKTKSHHQNYLGIHMNNKKIIAICGSTRQASINHS